MKLKNKSFKAKLLAASLSLTALAGCEAADPGKSPEERSALMELDLMAKTDPTFNAIATYFPQDWSDIRTDLAKDYAQSTSSDEVFAAAVRQVQEFMASKTAAYQQAPSAAIIKAIRSQRDLFKALETENPDLCNQIAADDLTAINQISEASLALISKAGQARIDAIKQAMDQPETRTSATDEDRAALDLAIKAAPERTSNPDAKALLNPDEKKTCGAMIKLLDTLATMPEDRAARLYLSTTA